MDSADVQNFDLQSTKHVSRETVHGTRINLQRDRSSFDTGFTRPADKIGGDQRLRKVTRLTSVFHFVLELDGGDLIRGGPSLASGASG